MEENVFLEIKASKNSLEIFQGAQICGRPFLNLVLPCTLCKIFVQKYKRHGLMFNVCVLLLLAPEKLMFYVMSLYIL